MNLQKFESMNTKEQMDFSRVCNMLLAHTYILREDEQQRISRDYTFIERNFELFSDYLSLSGWQIYKDSQYGVIFVKNVEGYNKLTLSKLATVVLIILRIIYEEKRVQAGVTSNVSTTTGELLVKMVNEFSIYPKKPQQKELKDVFQIFDSHNLIRKLGDSYDDVECKIQILPSILIAVSNERCKTICDILKMDSEEENDEETDAAVAD
jgi:hypothetical protein